MPTISIQKTQTFLGEDSPLPISKLAQSRGLASRITARVDTLRAWERILVQRLQAGKPFTGSSADVLLRVASAMVDEADELRALSVRMVEVLSRITA
jgi:hypothetical protein